MVSQKKTTQLEKITSFLDKSPNFVLLKFEKTTHSALESLRKELKKNNARVMVIKNTVLQKAINKLAASEKNKHLRDVQKVTRTLRDNTALLGLGVDWNSGMNTFYTFAKSDKTVSFKTGYLDKKTYAEGELIRIAALPGKSVLMGQIIGSMKSPISHFTNALKYNSQKFVYILNAKVGSNQKN
ncbi:MAG: 50S ribosomal protein L10 [Patescibacteria group bacterium]